MYSDIDFVMLNPSVPLAVHRPGDIHFWALSGFCTWKAKFPHIEYVSVKDLFFSVAEFGQQLSQFS
jgi:hypothetical protein